MKASSQQSGPTSAWATPLAVWAFLTVLAVSTTQSEYAAGHLMVLAALYGLLAAAFTAAARLLACLGPTGRVGGAMLVGLGLAWHWREQTRVEGSGATLWTLEGALALLAAVVALGAVVLLLEWIAARRAAEPASKSRLAIEWVAASAAFFGLLGATYFGSNTMRWHVLRHNKMIGTTAYHLFAEPVTDVEAADWSAHRGGAPAGQPAWVYDLYIGAPAFTSDAAPTPPPRAAATAAAAAEPITTAPPRPDIVFVMLDTLRADALAAYGGNPELMPQLNARAADATVFTDVLANAPWTQPSVASLFTGLPPEEHGVVSIRYRLSAAALTLAELLESQGYETAAFVANSVIVGPDSGFSRGFGVFEYIEDAELTYARADTVTDKVAAWLAERRAGRDPAARAGPPLFLYVHYLDPHVPYLSSDSPEAASGDYTIREARRFYEDELRFLDGELDRLFGNLDSELPGPRALFVTSDHGEEFGEHDGLGHSQTLYSEVLEIPALLQIGDADAVAIDAELEGRDFFDLLLRLGAGETLDAATWAATAAHQARVASLQFAKDPGRSELIHYLVRPYRDRIYNRMIQRGDWRYIWSAFGRTDELYDLSSDPLERRNVARHEPDLVASLRAQLDQSPPYWTQLVPIRLTEEALEQLRQLGYLR